MTHTHHPSLLHKVMMQDDLLLDSEFLSTLPMEKGWVERHLYHNQGFWHNPMMLQGVLTCQEQFQANDTDILLVTLPKSGTTWLKALSFALPNLNRYPNIQSHPLVTSNPHALVPFMEIDLNSDKDFLPGFKQLSSPRLFSTHCPYILLPESLKDSTCKIVYLCRSPKDTFISCWHFSNRLRQKINLSFPLEEAFDMFCKGVSPSGPFWEHILGYWKESLERPEKIMFLRYEEMKMKPSLCLKELAKFIGCPFSEEEETQGVVEDILKLCSFDNLSKLEVNKSGMLPSGVETNAFFRRGQVGDWKNYLTEEMVEQLNSITEKKLAEHGVEFWIVRYDMIL